jgi:cysteine rich repeat protein
MSSLPAPLLFSAPRLLAAIMIVTTTALAPSLAYAQTVPLQFRSEAMVLMQVCHADYHRLCSGVQPGGGRILACLQNHANELGPSCAQSMARAQALKDSAAAAGALPK